MAPSKIKPGRDCIRISTMVSVPENMNINISIVRREKMILPARFENIPAFDPIPIAHSDPDRDMDNKYDFHMNYDVMMDDVFRKLQFKDNDRIYVLNAPKEFQPNLRSMEVLTTVKKSPNCKQTYDFAMFFVKSRDDIRKYAQKAADKMNDDGLLWFAYPKKSSKNYKSDISRDDGWQPLGDLGYEPVRQISIDDDWSALRFRKVENIRKMRRSREMALSEKGKEKTLIE